MRNFRSSVYYTVAWYCILGLVVAYLMYLVDFKPVDHAPNGFILFGVPVLLLTITPEKKQPAT